MRDYIILRDDMKNIIVPANQVKDTNMQNAEKVKLAESCAVFSIDMNHKHYYIFMNDKNQFIVGKEDPFGKIFEERRFSTLEDADAYTTL